MALHIIKLAVGCDTIEEFARWQASHRHDYNGREVNIIRTRHCPKQADEILSGGGSSYRVIKGMLCCRQQIVGFDRIDTEEGLKTLIYIDPNIIRTQAVPRRAFQGWRYLKAEDAPKDIGIYGIGSDEGSFEMQSELRELGLI